MLKKILEFKSLVLFLSTLALSLLLFFQNCAKGDKGNDGINGVDGSVGSLGTQGPSGPTGATGPIGLSGISKPAFRLTRSTITSTDTVANKDSLCISDISNEYVAANTLDLNFVSPDYAIGKAMPIYVNTTGNTAFRFEFSGYKFNTITASSIQSKPMLCLNKNFFIRSTRSNIDVGSTDTAKDALCASEIGSSYQAIGLTEAGLHLKSAGSVWFTVAGYTYGVFAKIVDGPAYNESLEISGNGSNGPGTLLPVLCISK